MRDGPWKLVTQAKDLKDGPALFQLEDDIAETRNLAADHPQRVKSMLEALEAWKKDVATGATAQPDFSRFNNP